MLAIILGRAEMEIISAELGIAAALRNNTPVASKRMIEEGERILVYREEERQWVRPVTAEKIEGEGVFVRDYRGQMKPFNISAAKKYNETGHATYISRMEARKDEDETI